MRPKGVTNVTVHSKDHLPIQCDQWPILLTFYARNLRP